MRREPPRRLLWCLSVPLCGMLASTSLVWSHDGEDGEGEGEDVVVLLGTGALTPPEGAPNQEASGFVHLRQKGDRNAVHIRVAHLEPGATYDVKATSGENSASIGSITTHDGTPPPPRCFSAKLTVPAPPGGEGDGAGGFDRHSGDGDGTVTPRGLALFFLNDEGTQLSYWIVARGIGDIASASLKIGDATGELEADGHGSFDVTAEQLAALAAGQGSVTVVGSGDPPVTISGAVVVCFEELREERAARKAGRGALRIDTGRGDTLPLGAASIADLVGVTFTVVDAAGNVVLSGSVAELMEGGGHRPDDGHGDPPGADEPCEADLSRPDPAPDADATGEVEIEGEELEVEVARLAARALYDVVLSEPQEGGATATIGQIKTGWAGGANHEFVAEEGVALPFGKTKISELVGHGVEIKDAEGVVVLKGAIPATACAAEEDPFTGDHDGDRDGDREGGGGALDASPADAYFQLDEVHDASFVRGDANDDGGVDLADAVSVLLYLFQGQTTPYCADASDADDSGDVVISDAIVILQFLYQGGAVIAAPYPQKGYDSTADELFCRPFSG